MLKKTLALAALSFSLSAHSAFVYDESIDGDLDDYRKTIDVHIAQFELGFGENIFKGTALSRPLSDSDAFLFSIVQGGRLTSVTFDYQFIIDPVNTFMRVVGISRFDPYVHIAVAGFSESGSFVLYENELGLTAPLEQGLYKFQLAGSSGSLPNPWDPIELIYTATFNVSSIPIPAATWLFGSALIGLVNIKRKTSI